MEVTQAEFARRIGVSKPYITKLVKEGKLSLNENGKLDLNKALKAYNHSKHPSHDLSRENAKKQRGVPMAVRKSQKETLGDNFKAVKDIKELKEELGKIDDEEREANKKLNGKPKIDTSGDDKSIPDDAAAINRMYNKARAAEKLYVAKLRELEAKEKSGELLRADMVKKQAAEMGNLVTQKLYNMTHKLSPLLVGLDNPRQAKEILEAEIENVLENLNRMANEF